ncbi:unnamed protein product [Mytilus coruscus]|uniref:Uncharacterized protein n=1 Tax=Mytilus coruscus TaxID=42192 RepID=A0A6J8CKV4_MYTCO|nr:unnamed protein product [Mytilus coruscus]
MAANALESANDFAVSLLSEFCLGSCSSVSDASLSGEASMFNIESRKKAFISLNIEHVESEGLSEITVAEDNVETTDCAEGECSKAFSEPKEKPSKKRGNSNSQAEDHYFVLEEMKMQKVELYRMKKIKIMEEMLVLKKRSTKALEEIRDSLKADQGPLCLSPIIKIHEM